MSVEFHREYLLRLPLPLAQLYSRAYNAPAIRSRYDNTFYLFEAAIKLATCPLVAQYLVEVQQGGTRVTALDRILVRLALPTQEDRLAMLRGLAEYFGTRPDAASHPLGHLWNQLNAQRDDLPAVLALYRRIQERPDAERHDQQGCSLLQLFDALIRYRNTVFRRDRGDSDAFYESEVGPLLFPVASELLANRVVDSVGPPGSRLVYLNELRVLDDNRLELTLSELVGLQAERIPTMELTENEAEGLAPNCIGVLWPGRSVPVQLDPLVVFRPREMADEVLFLNRDRTGTRPEYLGYSTGTTEHDRSVDAAIARLMTDLLGRNVNESELDKLRAQIADSEASLETLVAPSQTQRHRVGDYEILAEVGRGGMGVVYLARQLSLGRIVALKMLPAQLAGDDEALRRFRREMRALGRCEHPHIVKVLASGKLPDGQHYYAMEFVPGADLETIWREVAEETETVAMKLQSTRWSEAVLSASWKQRTGLARRAHRETGSGSRSAPSDSDAEDSGSDADGADSGDLVDHLPLPPLPETPQWKDDPASYVRHVVTIIRDAARAVQAVHDQGIVHRDIKPANLMLTPDGNRIVLMDFGLAKGDNLTRSPTTASGFLGTLRYAAPEQLATGTVAVDHRADIRALGVTLWELLTRRHAFDDAEDEYQLASHVLSRDLPRLRSIDPSLDQDLEAILSRATQRDVARRLSTARELADYLQLYLEGEPLPIRPPGLGELGLRWIREHRGLVATFVAANLVIIATVISSFVAIRASQFRAIEQRDRAQLNSYTAQMNVAQQALDNSDILRTRQVLSDVKQEQQIADVDRRGFEWFLYDYLAGGHPFEQKPPAADVQVLELTDDGSQWIAAGDDGRVYVWDTGSFDLLREFPAGDQPVQMLAASPDASLLATASDGERVNIWDLRQGEHLMRLDSPNAPTSQIVFLHDSRHLVTGADIGRVTIWDATAGTATSAVDAHSTAITALKRLPTPGAFVSGDAAGKVNVWRKTASTWKPQAFQVGDSVACLAASSQTGVLAVGMEDGNTDFWLAEQQRRLGGITGSDGTNITTMDFAPFFYRKSAAGDVELLAAGGDSENILVRSISIDPGTTLGLILTRFTIPLGTRRADSVRFTPDGGHLASIVGGSAIRRWEAKTGLPRPFHVRRPLLVEGHRAAVNAVAFSPDNQRMVSASADTTVRLWHPEDGSSASVVHEGKLRFWTVRFSPDGALLAAGGVDPRVFLFDVSTGAIRATLAAKDPEIWDIRFSHDGSRIATAGSKGTVEIWDVTSQERIHAWSPHPVEIWGLAFSRDDRLIATVSGEDRIVKIWNTDNFTLARELAGHKDGVTCVEFAPRTNLLATGSEDKTIRTWDLDNAENNRVMEGHTGLIFRLAFHPHGKTIASGSIDTTVRLWNVASGANVGTLRAHQDEVMAVAFSADGNRLASASTDQTIRIWQATARSE